MAMIPKDAAHTKARALTPVSNLVTQDGSFGHWAHTQLSSGEILNTRSVPSSGASQLQVRNNFLDLERLLVAVSLQWAGGLLHNGILGWMQSYLVCSGFEPHSGTYSNTTYGTYRIHLSSHGLFRKRGLLG